MNEKIKRWNEFERELQMLWERSGKPRGAAWAKIAAQLWEQQANLEREFTPLLFEWAEKNDCGQFGMSVAHAGFIFPQLHGWFANKGCYQKIKEQTGIKASSQRIRALLVRGWWFTRGEKEQKAIIDDFDKFVRAMSDAEFAEYIDGYCTASVEGANTKKLLLKLRAEHKKEKR